MWSYAAVSVFQVVTEEKFCILFQSQFTVGGGELNFQVWVSIVRLLVCRVYFALACGGGIQQVQQK